jgi:hypothetical protein
MRTEFLGWRHTLGLSSLVSWVPFRQGVTGGFMLKAIARGRQKMKYGLEIWEESRDPRTK